MTRQLVAAALGAALLHLNVERADRVCAKHSAEPRQVGHAAHAMEHHHGHAAAQSQVANSESCETPAQADCCQALLTCSLMPSLAADESSALTWKSHDAAVIAAQQEPASKSRAPEPPPPRA